MAAAAVVAAALGLAAVESPATPLTLNERVQKIASGLRCVACENLSVADSPSKMAGAMRSEIRDRLRTGQTDDQLHDYFVGKYGEWILLSPPASGLALVPWIAPALAFALGVVALAYWLKRENGPSPSEARASPAERARIRRELALLEEPE